SAFADQPLQSSMLAEGQRSTVIADQILIVDRVPDRIGLLAQILDGVARSGELIQSLLRGLAAALQRCLRIHCSAGIAPNGPSQELANEWLAWSGVRIAAAQVQHHFQHSLTGSLVPILLIGVSQPEHLAAQLFRLDELRQEQLLARQELRFRY